MKSIFAIMPPICCKVAPFVGAGIEIKSRFYKIRENAVAPFVGAGIEIAISDNLRPYTLVAPFVGAGIEIRLGTI